MYGEFKSQLRTILRDTLWYCPVPNTLNRTLQHPGAQQSVVFVRTQKLNSRADGLGR